MRAVRGFRGFTAARLHRPSTPTWSAPRTALPAAGDGPAQPTPLGSRGVTPAGLATSWASPGPACAVPCRRKAQMDAEAQRGPARAQGRGTSEPGALAVVAARLKAGSAEPRTRPPPASSLAQKRPRKSDYPRFHTGPLRADRICYPGSKVLTKSLSHVASLLTGHFASEHCQGPR